MPAFMKPVFASVAEPVKTLIAAAIESGNLSATFRVGVSDVPEGMTEIIGEEFDGKPLPGHLISFDFDKVDKNTGEHYEFCGSLVNVAIDFTSFSLKVVNAYWRRIWTQRGDRAVITFSFARTGEHSEVLCDHFDDMCDGKSWSTFDVWVNPAQGDTPANFSLSLKGASENTPQCKVYLHEDFVRAGGDSVLDVSVLKPSYDHVPRESRVREVKEVAMRPAPLSAPTPTPKPVVIAKAAQKPALVSNHSESSLSTFAAALLRAAEKAKETKKPASAS